jgi:mono/diheme cytochrome c family protein
VIRLVLRRVGALLAAAACAWPLGGQAQATPSPADASASAAAQEPDATRGRRAFQRFCLVCHGAQGEGGLGPPLQGVLGRLTPEQVRHQILEPRNSMPRLYPAPVNDATLGDLLAFMERLK